MAEAWYPKHASGHLERARLFVRNYFEAFAPTAVARPKIQGRHGHVCFGEFAFHAAQLERALPFEAHRVPARPEDFSARLREEAALDAGPVHRPEPGPVAV